MLENFKYRVESNFFYIGLKLLMLPKRATKHLYFTAYFQQKKFPRMPIVDEKAPRECDFDAMVDELKGLDANTACVFNCQVRTSLLI